MASDIVLFDESAPAWERAFYAFLAEKERRSGSRRTADAYSRTLQRFFGTLGKPPEEVTSPDVFVFAPGGGPSGKEPKAITIGARLACISSFFRFLIRMKIVSSNPCDEIERPTASPAPPRDAGGSSGSGHRPDARAHGPAPVGDIEPQGGRRLHGWRAVLRLSREGR